jgi:hypothetical protein
MYNILVLENNTRLIYCIRPSFYEKPVGFFSQAAFLTNETGLPDGTFSNQKIPIWEILDGIKLETFCIFYVHLEYNTAFGIFYEQLVI